MSRLTPLPGMSARAHALIGRDIGLAEVRARLAGDLQVIEEPERRLARLFLDSFDWRLYRDGLLLAFETEGNAARLACAERDGGVVDLAPTEAAPRFAADLPAFRLRDRVAEALGVRALLPLVQVAARVQP